jgi:hypothetical protein
MLQIHIDSTTKQVRYIFLNENIYQVTKGFIQTIIFMKKLFEGKKMLQIMFLKKTH